VPIKVNRLKMYNNHPSLHLYIGQISKFAFSWWHKYDQWNPQVDKYTDSRLTKAVIQSRANIKPNANQTETFPTQTQNKMQTKNFRMYSVYIRVNYTMHI